MSRRDRCRFTLFKGNTRRLALAVLALLSAVAPSSAHESTGHAGFRDSRDVELESEFYVGRHGYLHGGLGAIIPLNEQQRLGVVGHFVREESDGEIFPSLGADFIQELGAGFQLEAFSFGYFPVAKQHAWAVGLRGSRRFALNSHLTIAPFIGPAYARVQAIDETTAEPITIGHILVLGGVAVHAERFEFSIFASRSFFSRDPVGLETHVDLEEMTHFAAYENNDGFARNSAGAEASYSLTEWLKVTGRYALILYDDETRHSLSFIPTVEVGTRVHVFGGVQLLRGDGLENDIVMGGASVSF